MIAKKKIGNMIEFKLNYNEEKEANDFLKEHRNCGNPTAIGGHIKFIFTPTSVGDSCILKCVCGKEKDITDYNCW